MAQTAEQMFSNPGDESAVAKAWESFLNGEDFPAGALRSLVDSSWQRCADAHVDPNRACGPQPVSQQDLYLLRERQRDLLEASAPVMACARNYLTETGTLMALADTRSTILSTEGDNPALHSAENIRLVPGVSWSEALCGTNAIGTALAVGQPVQIHSAEHFCAASSAGPVRPRSCDIRPTARSSASSMSPGSRRPSTARAWHWSWRRRTGSRIA